MTDLIRDFSDDSVELFEPQWGKHAPRGGKSVLNRVLKEGTRVPLFLGQTFINSLRDLGYSRIRVVSASVRTLAKPGMSLS